MSSAELNGPFLFLKKKNLHIVIELNSLSCPERTKAQLWHFHFWRIKGFLMENVTWIVMQDACFCADVRTGV